MRFLYNLQDNTLRLYPESDERLPQDQYLALKGKGYQWWPRHKAFVARLWAPEREDIVWTLFGLNPVDMDEDERQQDLNDRVQKYQTNAQNAQDRADTARTTYRRILNMIPPGQPVLVDHHSAGRHLRDLDRIDRNIERARDESEAARMWQRRAERALEKAENREDPASIKRRILGLEAERAKCCRQREQPGPYDDNRRERHVVYYDRWIEHLDKRLAYWRAVYAASGGIPADQERPDAKPLEVGGAVRVNGNDRWLPILKLNRKTVAVRGRWWYAPEGSSNVYPEEIREIRTRAEVEALQE